MLLSALACAFAVGVAPASAASTASPLYGQQMHPLWYGTSDSDVTTQLDLAQRSNAGLIRADLSWSTLQLAGPTSYDKTYLAKADRFVDGARQRGMQVLFVVMSSPCWASSAPDTLKQGCAGSWWDRGVQRWAPTDPADYARALKFLANRWKGKVLAYEIWNEPNSTDFWNVPDGADSVGRYVDLVRAAYPAVKSADPGAQVIAGSTMHADFDFVASLYDHGIKGSYDGLSIHPYNEWRDPDDPWRPEYCEYTFKCGTETTHDVMTSHGDDKPLWLTEFGWSTCNDFSYHSVCVTPDQQADYLTKAYADIRGWSYVKTGVWYETHDEGTDPSVRNQNHGLVTYGYTEKPAYGAYRDTAAPPATTPIPLPGPLPLSSTSTSDPSSGKGNGGGGHGKPDKAPKK